MRSIKVFKQDVVKQAVGDINGYPLWNCVDSAGELLHEITFHPNCTADVEMGDLHNTKWKWSLAKNIRAPGRVTLRLESVEGSDWVILDLQDTDSAISYRNFDASTPGLKALNLIRNKLDNRGQRKTKPKSRKIAEDTADRCVVC